MAADLWTPVVTGVFALVGGAIGALCPPLVNWSIEKRRQKRNERIARIASWRAGIAAFDSDDLRDALITSWYNDLRPNLPADEVKRLEHPRALHVAPENNRGHRDRFTAQVDRIERKWKLA